MRHLLTPTKVIDRSIESFFISIFNFLQNFSSFFSLERFSKKRRKEKERQKHLTTLLVVKRKSFGRRRLSDDDATEREREKERRGERRFRVFFTTRAVKKGARLKSAIRVLIIFFPIWKERTKSNQKRCHRRRGRRTRRMEKPKRKTRSSKTRKS